MLKLDRKALIDFDDDFRIRDVFTQESSTCHDNWKADFHHPRRHPFSSRGSAVWSFFRFPSVSAPHLFFHLSRKGPVLVPSQSWLRFPPCPFHPRWDRRPTRHRMRLTRKEKAPFRRHPLMFQTASESESESSSIFGLLRFSFLMRLFFPLVFHSESLSDVWDSEVASFVTFGLSSPSLNLLAFWALINSYLESSESWIRRLLIRSFLIHCLIL